MLCLVEKGIILFVLLNLINIITIICLINEYYNFNNNYFYKK